MKRKGGSIRTAADAPMLGFSHVTKHKSGHMALPRKSSKGRKV